MNFPMVARRVQSLNDVDPQLTATLRNYVYDLLGMCQEVHREMGPFLNEYMYQDALEIMLEESGCAAEDRVREYYFSTEFHGRCIKHKHYADFLVNQKILVECKAVETIHSEHRQQLWNYMRLSGIRIGILYNFVPIHDQCEKYYFDPDKQTIFAF